MRQAMTVDAPAMPDVGVTTDTTATGSELSPSSTLSDFEATGACAERVGGGDPDVFPGLRRAAGPDRRLFVLEMERWPVSNRASASPGVVPGTEFERHLGNPD
jgi:hypothetical protein